MAGYDAHCPSSLNGIKCYTSCKVWDVNGFWCSVKRPVTWERGWLFDCTKVTDRLFYLQCYSINTNHNAGPSCTELTHALCRDCKQGMPRQDGGKTSTKKRKQWQEGEGGRRNAECEEKGVQKGQKVKLAHRMLGSYCIQASSKRKWRVAVRINKEWSEGRDLSFVL